MSLPALPPVGEPGTVEYSPKTVEISGAQVGEALFGKEGPGFKDLLAAVNPLQHIPVVGTIYRHLTGDTISPGSRLAGGLLYGGPLGLAGAAVNAAIEGMTGKDMGDHVLAMVVDPKAPAATDAPVMTASAAAAVAPAAGPAPVPTAKPAIGPEVTANPVPPVQADLAPPAALTQAAPPPKAEAADGPLTPEAYARAMAKANGRNLPQFPTRAGAPIQVPPRPPAQNLSQAPVPELSNEQFAQLLNSLTGSSTMPAASDAAAQVGPPAPPTPVAVPATYNYRPPARLSPYSERGANRLTPLSLR